MEYFSFSKIDFNIAIILITAFYLISSAFIVKTHDMISAVLFKIIPVILGIGCLVVLNNILILNRLLEVLSK